MRLRPALILSLVATLAASLVLIAAQPVRSHWWIYDNADPSYTAAGLELMAGRAIRFVDHPGLPLTELTGIVFGVDYLLEGAGRESRDAFADRSLLDLDATRPTYRGLAVALYLLGAFAAFAIVARLLGHWTWGIAGATAWFAAPGLAALSIQMRPDVPLAVLILLFAYLLAVAARERSAAHGLGAAAVAGFCVMLKLHAIGLVVPLALLVALRPPPAGWWPALRDRSLGFVRRRRRAVVAVGAVFLFLVVLFNVERIPFTPTSDQLIAVAMVLLVVGDCLLLAWILRSLATGVARRLAYGGAIGAAFVAGAAVPVLLMLPEGLRAVANIADAVRGKGINEGAEPVSVPFSRLLDADLELAFIVFVFAGVAALWGLLRRDVVPLLWFSGALVLGLMAQSRLGSVHYYIPAFMLAVPGLLWLISDAGRRRPSVLVWVLLALIAYPSFRDRHATANEAERLVQIAQPSITGLESRLAPGEVAFTPSAWPDADTRYFELVHRYTYTGPTYPYRFLPGAPDAAALATDRGLRFRYYTGPAIFHVTGEADVELEGLGTYHVRRLTDVPLAVELLAGPGVTPG
jgi:Dolichyl-phosphate-mannose-protein mannosyltransferase